MQLWMRSALLCSIGIAAWSAAAIAQDKPAGGAVMPGPAEMKAMMERMKAVMSPGPHHKALGAFVGKWNVTMKTYMGGPGTPPMETKGSSEIKWVLDGRFIQEEFKCEMLMPDDSGAMKPVPFNGIGLLGYDNNRNLYTGSWVDTMSTAVLTQVGQFDPAGKTLTLYGTMDEPMLGVIGRMVKYVHRIESPDKQTIEIFDLHAGENFKVIEVAYTRK